MRGSVGLLLQEGKLRDTLERYFQAHRWRVVHFAPEEASGPRLGKTNLILFEPKIIDPSELRGIERLAGRPDGPYCLGLLDENRQPPIPDEVPGLGWLHKPFSRRQLEAALPAERLPSSAVSSIRFSTNGHAKKARLPIRTKITAPFVLLSIVLGLAAAIVVTRIVFDTVEERFTNQLIESGRLANEWMVLEEARLLETQRALARTEGMAEALTAGDGDRLRRMAYPLLVNDGVDAAEFIDAAGVNVLSLRRGSNASLEMYETSVGADLAGYEIVVHSLEGESDGLGDRYADWIKAAWGDYFYVSGPIYDDAGGVAGAVLVGEPMANISAGMRSATLAQISLYDHDGAPVVSTFLTPASFIGADLEQMQASADGSYTRMLNVANIEYREIVGRWLVRSEHDLGYLGASLPQSFLVTANQWTRVQVFGTVAVGLILVILVGVFVANRITDPLLRVVRASAEVAKGDLTVQVDTNGNDEVAALAATFNQMVRSLRSSRVELLRAYDTTLEGWSKALELRDDDTEGHTRRVVEMTTKLAQSMGVRGRDLLNLRRGAMLHDIGKMGIPDEILRKPSTLDEAEWEVMRRHPLYARDMLANIDYLREAMDIPTYHHERWDGTGYPYGLRAEAIPLAARVFAVADVFDALCSDRPYRRAWSVEAALEHIRDQSGTHFDPDVVQAFFAAIESGEIQMRHQRRHAVG